MCHFLPLVRKLGANLSRRKGDAVMVTSSNPANVRQAMKELRAEVAFYVLTVVLASFLHPVNALI